MALSAIATANWQDAYTGATTGAGAACSLVDAGNFPGSIGTINQNADWRMDRQSPPAGMTNLQIQKNGVGSPSTIACCLVPNNLVPGNINQFPGPARDQARARFTELTRMIHSGLTQSVGSRRMKASAQANQVLMEVRIYQVQGTFSA
jgi:hypothetical protein